MNAQQVASGVLEVLEVALQAEGVPGQLAAGVLEALRRHYLGPTAPVEADIAAMAGGLLAAIANAMGGADNVRAILDAEYKSAEAAVDAEAAALLK